MTAWRIALRELHEAGGTAEPHEFGDHQARVVLSSYGLATCHSPKTHCVWTITQKGLDVAEGRLMWRPGKGKKGPARWRWEATWLRALPRAGEVRL